MVAEAAAVAAEEKEFAEWTGSAGEASGAGAGAPLVEDVVEESAEEGSDADEPLAPKKRRVLRRTGSGKPVRPGKATQRQGAQAQPTCQTRHAAASAEKEAVAAKKATAVAAKKTTAAASSSTKRSRTPCTPPPFTDAAPVAEFDHWSFSQKNKKRTKEEDE